MGRATPLVLSVPAGRKVRVPSCPAEAVDNRDVERLPAEDELPPTPVPTPVLAPAPTPVLVPIAVPVPFFAGVVPKELPTGSEA